MKTQFYRILAGRFFGVKGARRGPFTEIFCGSGLHSFDEPACANESEAKDIMGLIILLHVKTFDAVAYFRRPIITARLLALDNRLPKLVFCGMGTSFSNLLWPRRVMFHVGWWGKPVKELEGVVLYVKQQRHGTLLLAYMQKCQPFTSPEALSAVKQPVLLISGDHDYDNGPAAGRSKMFRFATTVNVPDYHNHAAGTKAFAERMIDFLKEKIKLIRL